MWYSRRDVGRRDSNQRPFEQVGGNQVSLECLAQATNDICGRLLTVVVAGFPKPACISVARQRNLTGTPNDTPKRITNIPNMGSPFGSGSIYNGPEKIVIGIDLGTTMSCVLISRTVPDGSPILLLC